MAAGVTALSLLLLLVMVGINRREGWVLVQAYVGDTGDRIANPDPRVTSAIYSAFEVETKAKAASPDDFELWADWEGYFGQKCSLIAVLYSDAEVEVVHNFDRATSGGTAFDSVAAGYAAAADEQPAGPGKAQVQCVVA